MIEKFNDNLISLVYDHLFWVVLVAVLLLAAALLLEYHRLRLQAFIKRNNLVMRKIPDILAKGFVVSVFIILLKKLVYYLPIVGVVQTKLSVWWVDNTALVLIYILLVIELLAVTAYWKKKGFIKYSLPIKKTEKSSTYGCLIMLVVGLLFVFFIIFAAKLDATLGRFLLLIISLPLLLLKMFCSGTYLGLFTGFLLGVFIIERFQVFKAAEPERKIQYLSIPMYILLFFIIISFFIFTGSSEEQFSRRLHELKNEREMIELLEAAPKVPVGRDERLRLQVMQKIIAAIKEKDLPWSENVYRELIRGANSLKIVYFKANLLRDSAELIAENGSIPLALSTADTIEVPQVQLDAFIRIFKTIPGTEKPKWAKEILEQAIKPVYLIKPWAYKSAAFKEIARAAAEAGEKDLAKMLFFRALDSAKMIKDRDHRCLIIKRLLATVADTGDSHWAIDLLNKMSDSVMKISDDFSKIRGLIEIAVNLARLGDGQGANRVFQTALQGALQLKEKNWEQGTMLVGEIVLAVAGTGEDTWADSIIDRRLNGNIKIKTRKKLQENREKRNPQAVEKKANIKDNK